MNGQKSDKTIAIVGLVLNLLIPGVGSLVGGKIVEGVIQLCMTLFGAFLIFTIIGFLIGAPMMIASWIWALVTGINLIKTTD